VLGAILENLATYWQVHLLLVLYTVLLAWHAWEGKKGTHGIVDYYVGGRKIGGVVIGLSFFATYSSTNSFVGFSGQAYGWGLPWLLLVPFVVGFSLFSWIWVAPRLRHFTEALDSLTIPDYVGFRFGSTPARVFAAIIILFASFFYMTAVFKGIGNLLEAFLEMPYRWAIAVVYVVTMLYTAVGGFISVIKTDAVQGVILLVAAILLFTGTVEAAGGLGAVVEVGRDPGTEHLFTWSGGVAFPLLLGVLFAGTIKFAVEPRQLSRFYALESREAAKTGVWVSTGVFTVVYLMLVPVGLYAHRVLGPGIDDTDRVVPELLATAGVFSEGVAAFLLVAMVAAAMSSLDSVLLVMASTCERDIVGILKPSPSQEKAVRDTRLYVALFATITAIIALEPPGGIVALTALSGAMYAACFFPAVVLGLWWRRGNGASVIASFATGLAVLFVWPLVPGSEVVHEVFPAVALSLAAYVGIGARTPSHPDPRVTALFREEAGEESESEAAPVP